MAGAAGVAFDLGGIALSTALLRVCASLVVSSSVRIARRVGVSDLVVGLTVVALATSAPEFAVTVEAALGGRPDLAVGNVVGSNLFNVGTVVAVLAALWDLHIARWEGALLVAALVAYIVVLFRAGDPLERTVEDVGEFRRSDVAKLVVGVAGSVGGANLLVTSASDLALLVGFSESPPSFDR